MRLYDTQRSGNAWKVRLMAGLLGLTLERRTLSIDRGELRSESFCAIAPMRQVPVLELDGGGTLCESMAILFYLAQDSLWWPLAPVEQARVLSWMSFEQERHMKPLAQLRLHLGLHRDRRPEDADMRHHAAEAALALEILEAQLSRPGTAPWVATPTLPSIADIALYPYTRLAGMGGIDLAAYPAILGWLGRIEALPGYQPLFPGRPDLNFSTAETAAL
ncbi:glutathione S-transferase family protein [Xylophilus rhododendri]|uniref:Glutathione S-transferase family protein n=1 Tax=Xylophilus rhododendri TaxID=2697032 RepID=A0A857J5H5_9BURK|nr:glutathione S-transferase family protein [Xylophilus rhododendri]QHI99230.1 glutathione S-transferase family protein [Xylophilus rhododendri]